jgi:hypothetical protein
MFICFAQGASRLPIVTVNPEDLVDPINRECCIRCETHPVSKAVRLPCAHFPSRLHCVVVATAPYLPRPCR